MGSTFDIVSIFDPAFDWEAMPSDVFDAYADSANAQRDLSLLAPYAIPGQKPTVYTMRECPQEQWVTFVKEASSYNLETYRALLCCLVSVRDLRGEDGLSMGPEYKPARYAKTDIIRAEALTRIPNRHLDDLREVAHKRSFFQNETEFGYRLPPELRALHAAWAAGRRAAANRSSQAASSETASAGSPDGTAP